MLDVVDILKLLVNGEPLPQQQFDPIPDEVVDRLTDAEANIVNTVIRAMLEGRDKIAVVKREIGWQVGMHGWFPACAVISRAAAHRLTPDDIADLSSPEVQTLVKAFILAASQEDQDDGAWTIPLAMFASLGERSAQAFTAVIVLCATLAAIKEHSGG